MTTKLIVAALLSALAVPAVANGLNAGQQMQADLLNLDASEFTANELAQIAGEDSPADRAERIRFIQEEKLNGASNF